MLPSQNKDMKQFDLHLCLTKTACEALVYCNGLKRTSVPMVLQADIGDD